MYGNTEDWKRDCVYIHGSRTHSMRADHCFRPTVEWLLYHMESRVARTSA